MTPYCQDWRDDKYSSPLCYEPGTHMVWSLETDQWEVRCTKHAEKPIAPIAVGPYRFLGMVET